jgi:transcriptional regulator with XRE-family HTH domain
MNSISAREFLEQIAPNRPLNRKHKTKMLFDISTMIIDHRLENGLSQKALAEVLGVTQGMVSKWESCEYNFTIDQVCKIAVKLNVKPQILFHKSCINGFAGRTWNSGLLTNSKNLSPIGESLFDCA